jgi:hypothetical protein
MKYDVLTPSGWSNFRGIKRQTRSQLIDIITETGKSIVCTENHKLKSVKYGWIEVDCLEIDDIITTIDGHDRIIYKKRSTREEDVYDLLEVSKNNEYYTNGILSHNCEFQGSSGTLISGTKLKELVYSNPLHDSNGLKIFENSNPKNTYVAIIDVSRGKGLDYSAFHIIDITAMPYKQVCTFRDSYVSPIEYTEIIHRIGKNYNEAYVLIEINDIGGQVSDLLYFDYEYENMISTESGGRSGKRISSGFGKNGDRGVRTTKSVKSVGCSILKLLVEQNQLLINDFETINELSTFSRKGVSYEAEPGCHDDLAMGLVLFAWLSSQQYFKDLTDINTMAKLRERSEEQLMEDVLPFGFHDNANELMESEAIVLVDRGDGSWLD